MDEELFMHVDGLLPDKENPLDFLIGDLGMDISKLKPIKNRTVPEYNQHTLEKTRSACTFVNAFRDRCYVNGIIPHDFDYTNLVDYAVRFYGYKIGSGWRTESAMNIVQKRTRIHRPQIKCNYVKSLRNDPDVEKLLDIGWVVGVTYNGNTAYNRDYQKDSILDGYSFGTPTYGHRTSMKKDKVPKIDDSYAGRIYNIYELKQKTKLFENGTYNPWVWIWIPETGINEQEVKRLTAMRGYCTEANKNLELAQKATNGDTAYILACDNMIEENNKKISTINQMLSTRGNSTEI